MGRKQRPLDPAAGIAEHFAHELRELRAAAGEQPFWKMARRCQVSKSALAAAAAGARLPSDRVARAFVEACGGSWPQWQQRLAHARHQADRDQREAHPPPSASPDRADSLPDTHPAPARDPAPDPAPGARVSDLETLWRDVLTVHGWHPKKIKIGNGDHAFTALYNGLHILGAVCQHPEPVTGGKTRDFLAKLSARPATIGLLVSPSGFTDSSHWAVRRAAGSKSIVMFDKRHIDAVLLDDADPGQLFDQELRNTYDSLFEIPTVEPRP